jgi:hypothetical protein
MKTFHSKQKTKWIHDQQISTVKKFLKNFYSQEEEIRASHENARKNKSLWPSRVANKE